MRSMRNWILGAAVVAGVAAVGTTTAQAAEFGFHVRGPVAYIPPCPGPGYAWVDGYWNNGYWVAGYWNPGVRVVGPGFRYDRGFDRFDHRGFVGHPDRFAGRGFRR
jgi:hypothetical protein